MRIVALTDTETLAMLQAARGRSARAHAMILLAIRHGLRASEVVNLPLDHLNLKERWVRLERLKGSKVTVQPLERHPGQPLLDEVRVLGRYLRERREDGSGVVFTSSHGGAMHRSTFFRIWRECATRAGLPPEKRHPHCAKHTLGSLLGRAGASAFHIQRALGHASITSSSHYVGLTDQDVVGTVKRAWMGAF
jgi:type 1 fimbriae regulatory protein FimB/type 1 fimbriae regulatory protein FimE